VLTRFPQQIVSQMRSVKAASLLSHVFNPGIVAAFAFLILLYPHNITSPALVGTCLTFGTVVPILIIILLTRRGVISDFFVSEKTERTKPFAGAISSYVVGSLLLLLLSAPPIVTGLMLCYAGNSLALLLINRRWKISVHASGIAGPTTALIVSLGAWACVFFALLIPVGWARMALKAHTPTQILAGALLTILLTWIQLRIYLAIL